MAGNSKSAKYYRKNPKARKKKQAYQAKFNKRPDQKRKRIQLIQANRKRGTYGNGDGKDLHHSKSGKLVSEPASKNRGRREKSRLKGSKRKTRKK